jgi:hypothetical protein
MGRNLSVSIPCTSVRNTESSHLPWRRRHVREIRHREVGRIRHIRRNRRRGGALRENALSIPCASIGDAHSPGLARKFDRIWNIGNGSLRRTLSDLTTSIPGGIISDAPCSSQFPSQPCRVRNVGRHSRGRRKSSDLAGSVPCSSIRDTSLPPDLL